MWEELTSFHWHNHAIFLDPYANPTRRAFCRQGRFDRDFLPTLHLWKFGAIGDEKQHRLVPECDDATRRRRTPPSRVVYVDSPHDFEPPALGRQLRHRQDLAIGCNHSPLQGILTGSL